MKKYLSNDEIVALRKQVCLGSCYTSDYENTFGVDPSKVSDFFEGFLSYIQDEAEENGDNTDWENVCKKYDNDETLINYADYSGEYSLYVEIKDFPTELGEPLEKWINEAIKSQTKVEADVELKFFSEKEYRMLVGDYWNGFEDDFEAIAIYYPEDYYALPRYITGEDLKSFDDSTEETFKKDVLDFIEI